MANESEPAKTGKTIKLKLHTGKFEAFAPDTKVCVLRQTSIGERGDPVPHTGNAFYEYGEAGTLTLGPGCTYVEAGKLASHEGHWLFKVHREAGEITVFERATDLLEKPTAELRKLMAATQHGDVLREWEAAERKRTTPRANLLSQLHERIRLWGNWAPPQVTNTQQAVG
jgi:hypothetical protein